MGVHYRLDHSIRIPRPDLGVKLGVPDACTRCHLDKTKRWSDETITKWYGPGRRPHYGEIIQAGRNRQPGAAEGLIRLAGDPLYPVIVRATALELLAAYPGEDSAAALERALMDGEALIRRTAVSHLQTADPKRHVRLIAPLLYDPVKAVRIDAASRLAGQPSRLLADDQRRMFEWTLKEYIAAMEYSGDFAFGRYNLGNLYVALGEPQKAIDSFRAAIKIDDLSYPAKVNLAILYTQLGRNAEAETLLREVVKAYPELYDVQYSLGLLLAEEKKYAEAEDIWRWRPGASPMDRGCTTTSGCSMITWEKPDRPKRPCAGLLSSNRATWIISRPWPGNTLNGEILPMPTGSPTR